MLFTAHKSRKSRMSDREIINAFQSEDQRQIGITYAYVRDTYYRMGLSIMQKNNVPEHIREDLYKDSLIIFYQNVKKKDFKSDSKLSSYFYSICRNITYANHRARKKESNTIEEYYLMNSVEQVSMDGDELTDEKRLQQVMGSVKERCQELLSLYYSDGKSLEEIADKMGYRSANAAKQAKYKCIEKIRKMVKTSAV